MKLLKGLIHSNIYISLAAVFLTVETQIQLGLVPQWRPYLFIIFFATLFEYNLHRLVTLLMVKDAIHSDKHAWVRENQKAFYTLVIISTIAFIVVLWIAKTKVLLTLAPIALLTLFYSIPIARSKSYIFRLREVPYLKLFLIAFVWAAITILLPVVHAEITFDRTHVVLLFAERFLFILAIAIPFDIRDMESDRQANLKTIPILLNEDRSLRVSFVALLAFAVLVLFHYSWQQEWSIIIPLLITAIVTLFLLQSSRMRSNPFYHHGFLDGTMLLQGLLMILFYHLNLACR
ncbi:MAG: UbiA family prenyltransferase [Cyclobacteriaceae bacterium]|nr:UbiA family prenyltransferase [Cyclobacteriaceae bacterium]